MAVPLEAAGSEASTLSGRLFDIVGLGREAWAAAFWCAGMCHVFLLRRYTCRSVPWNFGWAGGVWLLLAWLEDQPESLILAQDERWRQA
jgi:hypothetical protein